MKKVLCAIGLSSIAAVSQAGIIIDSIDVEMTSTKYNARANANRLAPDGSRLDPATAFAAADGAFNTAARENGSCMQAVEAFDSITYQDLCEGGRRNYGARYTISGSNSGVTNFQFGLDWGRGGFLSFESEESNGVSSLVSEDIWWRKRWSDRDVIDFTIAAQGDFTLTLLGFEGCCDGINSARYRNWSLPSELDDMGGLGLDPQVTAGDAFLNTQLVSAASGPTAVPGDAGWTTLAVNAVPVPGSMALALSGLLLVQGRRRRVASAGQLGG
ncbi:MAG: MYXO-CTERM sorting domain-containing protein [Pseudomonadota bacterium]